MTTRFHHRFGWMVLTASTSAASGTFHSLPALLAAVATALASLAASATAQQFQPHRISGQIQNTSCEVGPDGHLYVVSMNYHKRTGSAKLICEHPTQGHLYVAAYGQQDKREDGSVYFLERTGPAPKQPKLAFQPESLFGECNSGAVDWTNSVSIRANSQAPIDYSLQTSSDWLKVDPPHGSLSDDAPEQRHQIKLARLPEPGTYYAQIQALDGEMQLAEIGVQLHVASPESRNRFSVSAGNWRDMVAREFPVILPLNGTVISSSSDAAWQTEWSLEDGPAGQVNVLFPGRLNTEAVLKAPGRYRFNLKARQAGKVREDSVQLIVDVPGNEPPELKLTTQEFQVRIGESTKLIAMAQDDGLPKGGTLSYRWTREGTGVGLVRFSQPHAAETEVEFEETGECRIRCTVSDGVRETWREMEFTVRKAASTGARRPTAADKTGP